MATDAQFVTSNKALEPLKGGLPLYALAENKDTLDRLSAATGLKVDLVNYPASEGTPPCHAFRFGIPEGADREAFVERFISERGRAGLSKNTMGIRDNLEPGSSRSDPTAFYIRNDGNFTDDSLRTVEAGTKVFHEILPKHHASPKHIHEGALLNDVHRNNLSALKAMTFNAVPSAVPSQAPTEPKATVEAKSHVTPKAQTRRATNPSFS